jgi:conjugative transfer signal peptidase TraF
MRTTLQKMWPIALCGVLLFVLGCAIIWPLSRRLILNQTPSLPRGLYWLTRDVRIDTLKPGQLVWVQLPEQLEHLAKQRRYLPPHPDAHLLKPVAGRPGDVWCVRAGALFVEERALGPVHTHDSRGRPMPALPERCERLLSDQILVASPQPRSFDARYFGPTPATSILGRAHPVLIWE